MVGQSSPEMVQVAPGVSVTSKGSVWAVGSSLTGTPVQLYRSPTKVNQHWAKNIAGGPVGSFLYRPSISIELRGAHAKPQRIPRTGEYAIVALPRSAAFFSEFAYDFGIDPAKGPLDKQ
jgi:hypothetical protein